MGERHVAFLDGVTGYLGRWTLFWYLEELRDEKVAVLIRPQKKGDRAKGDIEARLTAVLESIGMTHQRHRVTPIAGALDAPFFGNREVIEDLTADCWLHIAGDITFKKLGDKGSLVTNRDYTVNFVEAARRVRNTPRTLCHTSTFFTFEKASDPDGEYWVNEEFHDPAQMEHHNAYGYSKLEAETWLRDRLQAGELPFNLLVFRPDIIMHHVPVKEVAAHNPGLITDDFKVIFQLLAAYIGKGKIKLPIPGGPSIDNPLKYVPVSPDTVLNISDVDSVTRAMMQLAVLYGDGGLVPDEGYRIFHLVNRWRPLTIRFMRELSEQLDPERALKVNQVTPVQFRAEVLPKLSFVEKLYYTNFVEPFIGYMHRARTHASTANVDELLGNEWHNFHPTHGLDIPTWLEAGVRQAIEKDFQ
jgi:nucleoside-diphosphate-sugar epimerase